MGGELESSTQPPLPVPSCYDKHPGILPYRSSLAAKVRWRTLNSRALIYFYDDDVSSDNRCVHVNLGQEFDDELWGTVQKTIFVFVCSFFCHCWSMSVMYHVTHVGLTCALFTKWSWGESEPHLSHTMPTVIRKTSV